MTDFLKTVPSICPWRLEVFCKISAAKYITDFNEFLSSMYSLSQHLWHCKIVINFTLGFRMYFIFWLWLYTSFFFFFFSTQENLSLYALLENYKPIDAQPPKLIFAIVFCKLCGLSPVNAAQISHGCLILSFSFVGKATEKDGRQPWVSRGRRNGKQSKSCWNEGGFHTLSGLLAKRRKNKCFDNLW